MSDWTRKEVLDKIQTIDPWKNSKTGERAPHKPLLILYAMGQLLCEGKKHIRFAEFYDPFAHLLEEFGPPRKSYHPDLARHGNPITPSIRFGISVRMRSG
jgi:putative restriction endonuclease